MSSAEVVPPDARYFEGGRHPALARDGRLAMVLVRYWAAAREAAGAVEERYDAATLADLLAAATEAHGPRFSEVTAVCSYLVDGAPVGRRDASTVALSADAVVEVLPPFAGG